VRSTGKLESHPCVITVEEMAAARHFIKTQVSLTPSFVHNCSVADLKWLIPDPNCKIPGHRILPYLLVYFFF
jgi:hypothetical protein